MFVPQKRADIAPSPQVFAGEWGLKIQHLTAAQFAKRTCTPSGLRGLMGLSYREFSELLTSLTGYEYNRTTICKFEKAVTGRYVRAHASSRYLRNTYKALIASYVQWRSKGRYTARVAMTGPHARRWKVTLIKRSDNHHKEVAR